MAKNRKGFTIIEVVLVLAIAGLIFLMVFIALPALQRSQRNTQREDDLSRFITAANDYQSNNSGKTPFETGKLGTFTKRYIDNNCTVGENETDKLTGCGAQFTDPDGEVYEWRAGSDAKSGDANKAAKYKEEADKADQVNHGIYYVTNSGCGQEEGTYSYDPGKRSFSFFYLLEGGAISCNDNH